MLTRQILEAERASIIAQIEKVTADLNQLKGALQFCDWTLENVGEPEPSVEAPPALVDEVKE